VLRLKSCISIYPKVPKEWLHSHWCGSGCRMAARRNLCTVKPVFRERNMALSFHFPSSQTILLAKISSHILQFCRHILAPFWWVWWYLSCKKWILTLLISLFGLFFFPLKQHLPLPVTLSLPVAFLPVNFAFWPYFGEFNTMMLSKYFSYVLTIMIFYTT
jgi:hypothetical protein